MSFCRRIFVMCCGDAEDDGTPYSRLDDSRDQLSPAAVVSTDHGGEDEADGAGHVDARTPQEIEQDALSKIVENAQNNIINVTQLDGVPMNTSEYIQRARAYEEAIQVHDKNVGKSAATKSPKAEKAPRRGFRLPGGSGSYGFGKKQPAGPRRLIEDSGNRAADWLGRVSLPPTYSYSTVMEQTAKVLEAVEAVKIEKKEDLVVYMEM